MSTSDDYRSGSSSSSSHSDSSSSGHHHHHSSSHHGKKKKKHIDDSDRFKKHGLSSIRRRKILSKITFWLLVLAAIGVIVGIIIVYTQVPARHYR